MYESSRGMLTSAAAVGAGNLYETMRGGASSTTLIENYQAQLKQREGEIVQLGVEVAGLERARDNLNAEVARLTARVDAMDTVEAELESLKKAYVATEQKYQTMLTVSGLVFKMSCQKS